MLSIIIPYYTGAGPLQQTLDSLDASLHKGVIIEVIVVDESNAGKLKLPQGLIVQNNAGKGLSAALNTGLARAGGEYIAYINPGDIVGPGYFAAKILYLEKYSDCDGCYGAYHLTEKKDRLTSYSDSTRYAREHLVNHFSGTFLPQSTLIWRKALLQRRKGHDETVEVEQDIELFVRSVFNGLRTIAIADDTKVQVNSVPGYFSVNTSITEQEKWRQVLKTRKKMFADLRKFSFEEDACFLAMSTYLFECWKVHRHTDKDLSIEFLEFAKKVCWPIPVRGSLSYQLLARMFGPEKATEMKYPSNKKG